MKNLKNLKAIKPLTRNDQKSISGGYNNGIKGAACLGEGVVCPDNYNMPCCPGSVCIVNAGGVKHCA